MIVVFAIVAATLAVAALWDEIHEVGRRDLEHISQNGDLLFFPTDGSIPAEDILELLSDIESLPTCADLETA